MAEENGDTSGRNNSTSRRTKNKKHHSSRQADNGVGEQSEPSKKRTTPSSRRHTNGNSSHRRRSSSPGILPVSSSRKVIAVEDKQSSTSLDQEFLAQESFTATRQRQARTNEDAKLQSVMEDDVAAKKRVSKRKAPAATTPGAVAMHADSSDNAVLLQNIMDDDAKKRAAGSLGPATTVVSEKQRRSTGPALAPAVDYEEEPQDDGMEDEYYSKTFDSDDDDKIDQDKAPEEEQLQPEQQVAHGRGVAPDYRHVAEDDGRLAVAVAVEDDEDNVDYIPSAIEYDPDAKPPLYKNRRFQLYGALAALLLLGIVVGVVVGVLVGSDTSPRTLAPTATPTLMPTSQERGEIVERFVALVGNAVQQPGTPEFMATDWILNQDPMGLNEDSENLTQRFLLALFYFFTTQTSDWRTCGAPSLDEDENCIFDVLGFGFDSDSQFYTGIPAIRWLSGKSECEWIGSICDDVGTIRAIDMWGNNITGPLPPTLAKFPFLQSISMAHNQFTGSIPEEYASMRHLANFELHYNALTGTISPSFYDANALQNFNVASNDLDGPIEGAPGLTIDMLEELKGLHLFDNDITGSFPTGIGNLKFLSFMRISDNQFDEQPIPTEMGLLTSLQEMWLDGNKFNSTIPIELSTMEKLTDLRVNNNRLTGQIPESLYELTDLVLLFLEKNQLTGPLSPSVGRLIDLEQLRLRENLLSGAIPSELALLSKMLLVFLHRNKFEGAVPQEVCANVGCGRLQFVNADCGGPTPPNPCECCTSCCDPFGIPPGVCLSTNYLDCRRG